MSIASPTLNHDTATSRPHNTQIGGVIWWLCALVVRDKFRRFAHQWSITEYLCPSHEGRPPSPVLLNCLICVEIARGRQSLATFLGERSPYIFICHSPLDGSNDMRNKLRNIYIYSVSS